MDLVVEIRRKNGYDDEMLKRIAMDPDIASSMQATLENLEQALKNLSEELYSKSTHFIFEFIQNADDNTYATGVMPTLRMRVEDHRASFQCNEVGFSRANVDAICRVGASTKKHTHGYIGEKGIGFKSVFKVADVVYISSGPYTFKLDKRNKLGMITPIWTDEYPVKAGWTSFNLHLAQDGKKLAAHTNDIKPSLLLFLRKLRSLTVEVALSNPHTIKIIQINRHETDDSDIITLERLVDGTRVSLDTNFLIKHTVKAYTQEPKRPNTKDSEISLAFPVQMDGTPKISAQDVHAFLPLRKFGFAFIIQADFLTSSSREDILTDLQWNLFLRTGIVEVFSKAVERFKNHPTLEYTWFRYLPIKISDSFFTPLAHAIKQKLRRTPIFRSTDEVYRLPSEVIILPARFRDETGQPLISRQFLKRGMYYLSSAYDVQAGGVYFEDLDVCQMSDSEFICCLQRMGTEFANQPEPWHEAVCVCLHAGLKSIPKKKRNARLTEIRQLKLLPLGNGSWISSSSSHDVFFDLKAFNIPNDVGLSSLKPGIKKSSGRYRLFEELGVKSADPTLVAYKILELHGKFGFTRSVAQLVCHAQFMFSHRYWRGFPAPTNLLVVDEGSNTAQGSELYMDLPGSQSMLEALPKPPARFIHSAYLQAYDDEPKKDWLQWLRSSLLVNVFPRLINGNLSPEFLAMAQTLDSRKFLVILKSSWSQWQGKLSQNANLQLAQILVGCEDGTSRRLSATYIGRKSLRHYELPFLPIDDPDDYHWNFLRNLGVSTEVNGSFFIKRLIQLQRAGCKDETVIQDTYKQLEARFHDDPNGIRNVFKNDRLIFASNDPDKKAWIGFKDVVWNGPRAMRSKVALKVSYPFLEGFFREKLRVENPPMHDLLVQEVKIITATWKGKGKNLTTAAKDQLLEILFDISTLLRADSQETSPTWLDVLHEEVIFPVDSPSGLMLCKSSDRFYIPDSGKYEKMCAGHVPLLSIDRAQLCNIQPLLDCHIFKPRLRSLWRTVRFNSVAYGPRILDNVFTTKYASRLTYIKRLVQHAHQSDPSSDILKHLASLNSVAIFSVDSIKSTFSIDDFKFTDADNLAIETDATILSISISKACPQVKWDYFICERLGKVFSVPKDKIQSIILQPMEVMEEWLDSEGAMEITVHPSSSLDDSWIKDANTSSSPDQEVFPEGAPETIISFLFDHVQSQDTNDTSSPSPHRARKGRHGRKRSSGNSTTSNPDVADLQDEFSATIAAMSRLSIASGKVRSGSTVQGRDALNLSQACSPAKYGSSGQSPGSSSKVTTVGKGVTGGHNPPLTVFEQQNGVLGEYFVYNMFLQALPGFGPDNWTSELRGLAPGMTPYDGPAVTDLVYDDKEGILTGLWYGQEKMEAWRGHWPVYYIEVKATSGTAREAFHMSRRQLEIALSLTIRDSNSVPEEVFVLLRVCGVRTSAPSFTVYVDPHRYFYDGELQIVADVDVIGI